jgi:hypothetical protein
MKTKSACLFCLALALSFGSDLTAKAQAAAPPWGVWTGKFSDGSGTYTATLTRSGTVGIALSGRTTLTGSLTWQSTSPVGGIVTVNYWNAGFPSKAYYSVVYKDAKTIVWSDPFFKVTLHKLGN